MTNEERIERLMGRLEELVTKGELTVNDYRIVTAALGENKRLAQAENVFDIQGSNGNWDYDEYMHGMYNGMALILGIWRGDEEIPYRNSPKEFLYEKNSPEHDLLMEGVLKNGGYSQDTNVDEEYSMVVSVHTNCTDECRNKVVQDVLNCLRFQGKV